MDLTKGSIWQLLRKVTIPASTGSLFQTFYNLVDTYFAGRISPEALAAIAKSWPIYFIAIAVAVGIGAGTTALISNSIGAKEDRKASIFLKRKGFKNVFQLKGGILNYLNKIEKRDSLWKGECFVFDNRISLKHKLKQGTYSVCSGCRKPFSPKDKKSYKYEEGVSCPRCYDTLSNSQKTRFRMRQNQISLAKKAGRKHKFQKEF